MAFAEYFYAAAALALRIGATETSETRVGVPVFTLLPADGAHACFLVPTKKRI